MKRSKKSSLFHRILLPGVLLLTLLFLFYGPIESFRLMWINTAMYSSRFKFLAQFLYTKNYINKVLAMNQPEFDRRTNDIPLENKWNDEIEFAEIKGNYYKGYIIKINDPRRIFFVQAGELQGKLLEEMTEIHDAIGGINASGYADPVLRGTVWGTTISDSRIISNCTQGQKHVMGGFNSDYKLITGSFTKDEIPALDYLWAFEFGPLLIVNGEKTELTSFSGGLAPRTAIGQTAQGHVLLVVVDGRQTASIGATFLDMQTILFSNGAINAINLDGGSSSTIVYQGNVVNNPSDGETERFLPNAILFR